MTQTTLTAYRNNNLFSNYYLKNYLNQTPEWKIPDHIAAFVSIKNIYQRELASIKTLNEKQLEKHFFNEIFTILGFEFEVTEATLARNYPDYTFFFDRKGLDDAHKNKDNNNPFSTNAIAIGEVKRWVVDLDKVSKNEYNISENPTLQIRTYLDDTKKKWGILTNGQKWRLYCKERHRNDYLEIDLESLIVSNNAENFKYFYYFFRKDAFVPSKEGPAFVDRVLKGSFDYATDISERLKGNVYWAMKRIAEGFIERKSNNLNSNDPSTLECVQNNTMILLYRFLFLLYAEGKGLLDLHDQRYLNYYSLYHIKHEIAVRMNGGIDKQYDSFKTSLLTDLKALFRMVDLGSKGIGIEEEFCNIPPYNGGLFDPNKHSDLENWEIGDKYLADAIDLLSRSQLKDGHRDFVDYSTLEIRHLGSIYEGLLEYQLCLADSNLVLNDNDWKTLEEYNADSKQAKVFEDFEENERVRAGDLYLGIDREERKSTGSFYTPDYIVDYIVENTIGPVIDKKWKEAGDANGSYIDSTLSINVLDPAMGSGHFLVGAVDFLSKKLLEAVQMDYDDGKIADTNHNTNEWARREVVSHCIYGVDLNELAVELAKVSLWLTTISKDKPLSFLDHRLKQGNSLIGAMLSDLKFFPGDEPKIEQKQLPSSISQIFFDEVIGKMSELERISDDTIDEVKKKETILEDFKNLLKYRMAVGISDVYTGLFFDNEIDVNTLKSKRAYYDLIWAFKGDEKEWYKKSRPGWFKQASKIAKDKSFFHWELEFPEIFFDSGMQKENAGWDVIVGNPPYIPIETMSELEKAYFQSHFQELERKYDSSVIFILRALKILKSDGYLGYISSITWQTGDNYSKLREHLFTQAGVCQLINLPFKVFKDAYVDTGIYIIAGLPTTQYQIFRFPKKEQNPDLHYLNFENVPTSMIGPPDYKIILELKTSKLSSRFKEDKKFIDFGSITTSTQGLAGNKYPTVENKKSADICPFLSEGQVFRYNLIIKGISFVDMSDKPTLKPYYEGIKKILIRRVINRQDRLMATFTEEKLVFTKDINPFVLKDTELDEYYVLAIINSKLISYLYVNSSTIASKDDFRQTTLTSLRELPIRQISFTTPTERRESLLKEVKEIYKLSLNNKDIQPILAFVEARLDADPEESDVVHDLLSFLAKQIVKIKQDTNSEIKKFLDFIEGEIGTSVDKLSYKTDIKEYPTRDFTTFIDVLDRNKKRLKEGYNPKSRAHYDILKEWFDGSITVLKPLNMKIDETDAIIDEIVNRLYGVRERKPRIQEDTV